MQKQGNTAANRSVVEQRVDQGKKSRDTPLSGKEKGDTVKKCRRNGTAACFTNGIIVLKFGDDGDQYSDMLAIGAFESAASEKIFEDKNNGMLA